MDFAKRQLEKYGWSEGQGLGKHLSGIKSALKPKVKLNTAGIGHDPAQEFTYHWWEDAFNNAASNINIQQTKEGVKVETVVDDSPEISAVKRSKIKRDKMQYRAFIKRETLTKSGSVLAPEDQLDPIEKAESRLPVIPAALNDEELFKACGGLTAHKAARHGHKLSGKLQRVKKQEEALLKVIQSKQTKNESSMLNERTPPKHTDKKNGKSHSCSHNISKDNKELGTPQNLCGVMSHQGTISKLEIVKSDRKREKKSSSQSLCEIMNHEGTSGEHEILTSQEKKKKKKSCTSQNLCEVVNPIGTSDDHNIVKSDKKKRKKRSHVSEEEVLRLNAFEIEPKEKKRKKGTVEDESSASRKPLTVS